MSIGHYHAMCQRYRGRAVEIRTRDGRSHRGVIQRVSANRVYLQHMGPRRNLGGFGYGFGGYGGYGFGGYGAGAIGWGAGIALGAIAGVALLSAFWI